MQKKAMQTDANKAPYWDEDVGLWASPTHGHTRDTRDLDTVHSIPIAAWKLVHAGMTGSLQDVPVMRVLENISRVQKADGEHKGCFRWFLEDTRISDTNAGFFTGLGLIVLHHEYSHLIGENAQTIVKTLLGNLSFWFTRELTDLDEQNLRYPNKCLGDLVCAWLIAEIKGPVDPQLAVTMEKGLDYYRENKWGWGEHMSDGYSKVCMDEFVALFMYAETLPDHLLKKAEGLYIELLRIDVLFGGGPRVPAIRSYAFEQSPRAKDRLHMHVEPYLDQMRPVCRDVNVFWHHFIRNLAFKHNIPNRFSLVVQPCANITVPCYGGAEAQAVLLKDMRLGAMSRYPIMDGIDQCDWGLAWQSFPVAFWHVQGDWGFLQWESEEGGKKRAHPANTRFHRECYTLSDVMVPSPLGQTRSRTYGNGFLVYRRMPAVSEKWPFLIDRFRMLDASGSVRGIEKKEDWHVSRVTFGAGNESGESNVLHIAFLPLSDEAQISRHTNGSGGWDLEVRYPWDAKNPPEYVHGIWYFQIGGSACSPPRSADAKAWT